MTRAAALGIFRHGVLVMPAWSDMCSGSGERSISGSSINPGTASGSLLYCRSFRGSGELGIGPSLSCFTGEILPNSSHRKSWWYKSTGVVAQLPRPDFPDVCAGLRFSLTSSLSRSKPWKRSVPARLGIIRSAKQGESLGREELMDLRLPRGEGVQSKCSLLAVVCGAKSLDK